MTLGALEDGRGTVRAEVQRAGCRAIVAAGECIGRGSVAEGWHQRSDTGTLAIGGLGEAE